MAEKNEVKEENKVEEVKETEYKLVEYPTQHTLAIQAPDGNILTTEQAQVLILNKVEEIKRVVG